MEKTVETVQTPIKRCAVCKIDLKGRFVYVDDRIESMLGSSMDELFAREFASFLDEADHEVFNSLLARHNHFETVYESTLVHFVTADGQRLPAWIVVSLNFAAGNPVNYQIIINPHTDTPSSEKIIDSQATVKDSTESGQDRTPVLPSMNVGPDGEIVGCDGALWLQVYGIAEGSHATDLLAMFARCNDTAICQQIETFLSDKAGVPDDAGIELPVFLPDNSLCRLNMTKRTIDNQQGHTELIFAPARRSEDQFPSEQLDRKLVGSMFDELQKTIRAAATFASKLGHEQYNKLDSQGNFQLLCLKDGLDKADSMLAAFTRMVDLAGGTGDTEVTDLNLIINQVHQQVCADFPQLTISARFGDLPKIMTYPDLLTPLLRTLIAGVINTGQGGDIAISVAVDSAEEEHRLQMEFHDVRLPAEFARRLADFFTEPITAGSRHFPLTGADMHIARYLADRLSATVSLNQTQEAGVTVQLALPTHSWLTGQCGHEQAYENSAARTQQVPITAD